jgi:hypothetical protein
MRIEEIGVWNLKPEKSKRGQAFNLDVYETAKVNT